MTLPVLSPTGRRAVVPWIWVLLAMRPVLRAWTRVLWGALPLMMSSPPVAGAFVAGMSPATVCVWALGICLIGLQLRPRSPPLWVLLSWPCRKLIWQLSRWGALAASVYTSIMGILYQLWPRQYMGALVVLVSWPGKGRLCPLCSRWAVLGVGSMLWGDYMLFG